MFDGAISVKSEIYYQDGQENPVASANVVKQDEKQILNLESYEIFDTYDAIQTFIDYDVDGFKSIQEQKLNVSLVGEEVLNAADQKKQNGIRSVQSELLLAKEIIMSLRFENQLLQKKLSSLTEELNQNKLEKKELFDKIEEANSRISDAKEQDNKKTSRLMNQGLENLNFNRIILQLEAQLAKSQGTVESLKSELSNMEAENKESEKSINTLKEENLELQNALNELKLAEIMQYKSSNRSDQQYQELEESLNQTQEELQKEKETNQKINLALEKMQIEKQECQEMNLRLQEELQKQKESNQHINLAFEKVQMEKKEHQEMNLRLQEEIESQKKIVNSKGKELDILKEQIIQYELKEKQNSSKDIGDIEKAIISEFSKLVETSIHETIKQEFNPDLRSKNIVKESMNILAGLQKNLQMNDVELKYQLLF